MSTILLRHQPLPPSFLLPRSSAIPTQLFGTLIQRPVQFPAATTKSSLLLLRKCLAQTRLSTSSSSSSSSNLCPRQLSRFSTFTCLWRTGIARTWRIHISRCGGQVKTRTYSWRGGLPEKTNSSASKTIDVKQERLLDRLKSKGQLSSLDAPPPLTNFQRLFPSLLFTLTICLASYAYSQSWTPPSQSTRLFPSLPQSATTILAIITLNTTIYLLWKLPIPLNWRLLNRYFISVPALPNSISMLGSVFSHQSLLHLLLTSFPLYIFGTTLCDQIGRGNFISLYLTTGVVSSFCSLLYHVALRRFHVYSLGASGAISGVIGSYVYFNPNQELYLIFFPFVAIKAAHFVGAVAGLEVWWLLRGYTRIDHVAHLSGLAAGVGYGMWLWRSEIRKREERRRGSGGSGSSRAGGITGSGSTGGKGIMGWFGWVKD